MAKKITGYIKLHVPAAKATPAPPVGPALGQHGVNIMDFCKAFNARTNKQEGLIIPVVITVFSDHSYTFITKTPPASILLRRAAGGAKLPANPQTVQEAVPVRKACSTAKCDETIEVALLLGVDPKHADQMV